MLRSATDLRPPHVCGSLPPLSDGMGYIKGGLPPRKPTSNPTLNMCSRVLIGLY